MYKILIVDQNTEIPINASRSDHTFRVPAIGERVAVKWNDLTRMCEVEDVWTHINADTDTPYQGAVQVIVRWGKGIDPNLYLRRYRS